MEFYILHNIAIICVLLLPLVPYIGVTRIFCPSNTQIHLQKLIDLIVEVLAMVSPILEEGHTLLMICLSVHEIYHVDMSRTAIYWPHHRAKFEDNMIN